MNDQDDLSTWAAEQPRRRLTITVSPSTGSRKSIELSTERSKLVHRTSILLSNPAGPETVLTQAEIHRFQRLELFGTKCFGAFEAKAGRRRRDGKRLSARQSSGPLSLSRKGTKYAPQSDSDTEIKASRRRPWLSVDFRQKLRVAVKAKWFRAVLYIVVLADVLVLALDNEYVTSSTLASLDLFFTVLLLLEVGLKILAFGLWGHQDAYFQRSRYRFLQVSLLLLSLISHVLPGGGGKWKMLRGLKTVRTLTLYAGLRRILKALMRAVPFLANVGTLSMFGLLAFSIFGLEAYSGSYAQQCTIRAPHNDTYLDAASSSAASSLGDVSLKALEALPRVYCSSNSSCAANDQICLRVTPPSSHVNFDTGLSSLFLVFLVVAQDGWVTDIMKPVIESSSFFSVLFFVAIVASMVFLVVNLFVAVITTAFMNFTLDEEDEKEKPHFMGKLDPEMEETQVNMIMGATLVIEDTIKGEEDDSEVDSSKQEQGDHQVEGETGNHRTTALVSCESTYGRSSVRSLFTEDDLQRTQRPGSPLGLEKAIFKREDYLSLLAKVHQWQSLHNLTVETTMQLIQNGMLMEELMGPLTRSDGDVNEQFSDAVIAPVSPIAHRKQAMTMEMVPDLAVLHASPSTHALMLQNTATTSPVFLKLQRFVLSKKFDDFITVCIFLNTLFLLVEYPNMSKELQLVLSISEYVFGVIFLAEMILRIVAMRGFRLYLSSMERIFDFVVVVCTTGNLVLNNLETSFSGLNSVSSLRTLRVTRLMMKYEGTRKLIHSVLKSSRGVLDVVVFMLVFQIVNSILAMQLFGGSHLVGKDGNVPRWNFDTFGRSFLTLLQVITGDQWSSIAYDAVDAAKPHWFMVPFLILNFIIGQYVLLNLFIAAILENFSITEEEAYQLQLAQIIAIPKELDIYEKIEEVGVRAFGEMDQLENVSNVKLRLFLGLDDDRKEREATNAITGDPPLQRTLSNGFLPALQANAPRLPRWKKGCRQVATNVWFARLVQFMILVSCICLVLDEPHPEMLMAPVSKTFDLTITTLNRCALVVLFVEFVVKVGAAGFGFEYLRVTIFHSDEVLGYVHRQTYMENKWNQLDLSLLLLAIADEIVTTVDPTVTISSVFRAGRVLRPLRMLNHNKEMKIILNAVARSLPHVGNVLALCFIVYIIFGVVGRSLFAGKLYSCNDGSVATAAECVGFYLVYPDGVLPLQEAAARGVPGGPILMPRVWQNARFSFDNIGAGFLALLEMTSLKWADKAFAAMDIAGTGKQPVTNASGQAVIFFMLYIYVGSLFVIRLFVGVLVEQFQRNNGTEILTESQKSWVDLEKFILLLKPLKSIPPPRAKLQVKFYHLCKHPYFSTGISIAIVLNLVLLLVSPRSQGGTSLSFTVIEIIFLAIFSLEALFKSIGLRQYYLFEPQGLFEVAILTGSIVAYFFATKYHSIIQAGRIFRMMRVLRFVHLNRGIYTVYQTFRASLRSLGQIFFLMFMIYFIFAIVARQLFGGVRYGPAMNSFSNFRSFGFATLLLFQIMSGDDWHLTMTDCMVSKPFCAERTNEATGRVYSDCGSVFGAAFFFITYVTLVVFVFLNLFIAVILENFRSCYLKSDVCAVSLLDFEAYREVFLRYDLNNTGFFPLWQLASFLAELPPGLRVDASRERTTFLQLRTQAQAQLTSAVDGRKRPYFNELLRILCIHQLGIRSLPYEQQRDRVKQIFIYRAKVAQMLVDSYVKGYILRWRMRRARLAALASLKVERGTSTAEDEGLSSLVKASVETQTEPQRHRHHHHHHHHRHRKQHRERSKERRKEQDKGRDKDESGLRPHYPLVLPPLVLKRVQETSGLESTRSNGSKIYPT